MNPSTPHPLEELKKMVIEQKSVALPEDTLGDPGIEAALVRLKQHDQLVTSLVFQVMQGEEIGSYPTQTDPDLDSELASLIDIRSEQARPLIEQYIRYKKRLDRMLNLAVQVSKGNEK